MSWSKYCGVIGCVRSHDLHVTSWLTNEQQSELSHVIASLHSLLVVLFSVVTMAELVSGPDWERLGLMGTDGDGTELRCYWRSVAADLTHSSAFPLGDNSSPFTSLLFHPLLPNFEKRTINYWNTIACLLAVTMTDMADMVRRSDS